MKLKYLTMAAFTSMALAGCASTEGQQSFMDQMNSLVDHAKNNPVYDFDEDAYFTSNYFRKLNASTNTDNAFHQKIILKTYSGIPMSKTSMGYEDGYGNNWVEGNKMMADDKRVQRAANFNLLRNGLMVNGASWNAEYQLHVNIKTFASGAYTRGCAGECATAEELSSGVNYIVGADISITDKEGNVVAHEDKLYEGSVKVVPTYNNKPSDKINLKLADRAPHSTMVLGQMNHHKDFYLFEVRDSYKYIEDKALAETIQAFLDNTILSK